MGQLIEEWSLGGSFRWVQADLVQMVAAISREKCHRKSDEAPGNKPGMRTEGLRPLAVTVAVRGSKKPGFTISTHS